MFKESVTIQDAVDLLNEMLKADSHATASFIALQTPCNNELAEHPTIQANGYGPTAPSIGPLGVINGLFGVDEKGYGAIAAVYDGENDNRKLIKFVILKDYQAEQQAKVSA